MKQLFWFLSYGKKRGEYTNEYEALNLGAIDFVAKPFRPDELGKIITKYLGLN